MILFLTAGIVLCTSKREFKVDAISLFVYPSAFIESSRSSCSASQPDDFLAGDVEEGRLRFCGLGSGGGGEEKKRDILGVGVRWGWGEEVGVNWLSIVVVADELGWKTGGEETDIYTSPSITRRAGFSLGDGKREEPWTRGWGNFLAFAKGNHSLAGS